MTKREQKRLTKEIIANVQKAILKDLPRVPEEWDGRHLRNWIGDRFTQWKWPLTRTEKRDMDNDILVHNL